MFIHSFRNFKNPGYFYLLVLGLILRVIPLIQFSARQEVVIFEPFLRSILPVSFSYLSTPWVNLTLSGVIVYLQAVFLNQVLIRYNIFSRPSYIPAAMYILVCSLFPIFLILQPVLVANFFMIWLVERLFSIYKTDRPISRAFDLGLIIACGTFIYFPFIIVLPMVWIGLAIYLPFSWRYWLSGLVGFLIPYFFVGVYFFLTDNLSRFMFIFMPLQVNTSSFLPLFGRELWTLVPVFMVLVLSVYFYQLHATKNLVLVQKSLRLLVFLTILSGLGYFLQPPVLQNFGYNFALQSQHNLLHFLIWATPFAVFLSYYFIFAKKKWLYESVFLILVACILFFQAVTPFSSSAH